MKKTLILLTLIAACLTSIGQECYWVFLTDKQHTTFDPYTYFDAHAIQRYQQCGADLYDITNYPLNQGYVDQVDALSTEEVGLSRWLNAVAVMATPAQILAIQELPCVSHTALIGGNMQLAQANSQLAQANSQQPSPNALHNQIIRMGGDQFVAKGYDGKGIRIAVLDGGFPRVNTHQAFKHLRDNNRIIDTWNFPTKKADVYGWNSHGLNTLSCITGIIDGKQLGLATGSEFMLYRTEVNTEPFKEEVWWMQGMERADQHGANIISSSLGYGKERYFTKDMDGTSYVARAANLAARKGILVCNSAGNEADSKQWKTIITPADADSVLCIGGIQASLDNYDHISFSSFGPSADGRLKPNVCAFGFAEAASPAADDKTKWVYGTSFSCPLVAGFAACAWQASPGKTAMEMFQLIQQSADLYPYYDYALGYGVPQADFFTRGKKAASPTFEFVDDPQYVKVHILISDSSINAFCNLQRADGSLVEYHNYALANVTPSDNLLVDKSSLGENTLNVSINGYTAAYRLKANELTQANPTAEFGMIRYINDSTPSKMAIRYSRNEIDLMPRQWGSDARYRADFYLQLGDMVDLNTNSQYSLWSPSFHVGARAMRAFTKWYAWGVGFEYANTHYNINRANQLDNLLLPDMDNISKRQYRTNDLSLELFQRIRIVPGGIMSKGVHLDLGVYASRTWGSYHVKSAQYNYTHGAKFDFRSPQFADNYKWNYGATARFGYDVITLYARYRFTGLATSYDLDPANPTAFFMDLPRLELGLELTL